MLCWFGFVVGDFGFDACRDVFSICLVYFGTLLLVVFVGLVVLLWLVYSTCVFVFAFTGLVVCV